MEMAYRLDGLPISASRPLRRRTDIVFPAWPLFLDPVSRNYPRRICLSVLITPVYPFIDDNRRMVD